MTIIGRRSPFIPNNKGMSSRAEAVFEAVASAHAKKYSEALKVDSPTFAIWRNTGGSIPCSCSHNNRKQLIEPGKEKAFPNPEPDRTNIGVDRFARHTLVSNKKQVVSKLDVDNIPDNKKILEDRINRNDTGDILDSMFDINDEDLDITDSFSIFNKKIISCPVCLGTGKTDSWQLHSGLRLLFDTSEARFFQAPGVSVDYTSIPNRITFEPAAKTIGGEDAFAAWAFTPPLLWLDCPRFALWDGENLLPRDTYYLEWSADGVAFNPYHTLTDSHSLVDGRNIVIRVKNAEERLQFTHVELLFRFSSYSNGHIAEVPQAYEEEFLDFQATVSAEVPPETMVSEGDYLCETKYMKIWKITSINRRKTSKNTIFGLSLDLKALQSYERIFKILNLWG